MSTHHNYFIALSATNKKKERDKGGFLFVAGCCSSLELLMENMGYASFASKEFNKLSIQTLRRWHYKVGLRGRHGHYNVFLNVSYFICTDQIVHRCSRPYCRRLKHLEQSILHLFQITIYYPWQCFFSCCKWNQDTLPAKIKNHGSLGDTLPSSCWHTTGQFIGSSAKVMLTISQTIVYEHVIGTCHTR